MRFVWLVALSVMAALAEEPNDRFYQAIRNNDLDGLRTLLKTSDVNTKDQRESTPLMYAAAYGSLDAMKLLLGAGADVNSKNAFDVTAIFWCASDLAKVRVLVSKGAEVNARSKQGRTPLMVAAAHDGNSEVVKLLIEKGANVLAKDTATQGQRKQKLEATALMEATDSNDTASIKLLLAKGAAVNVENVAGDTPLMNASLYGNLEVMKLLLAKGADVNARDAEEGQRVKNGPIALGNFTALHYAVTTGGVEAVKMLLDAGAKIDALDVRGMTPLMLAMGTDRPDAAVIRLLVERGADVNIKSKAGETAADWARKFNHPAVLKALGMEAQPAVTAEVRPAGVEKLSTPKDAALKSLDLLQRTTGSFFQEGGCVACHSQNLTGLAMSVARAHGFPVDEAASAQHLKSMRLQWGAFEQVLLQRMDPPGAVDTIVYSLTHFIAANAPADRTIDAMIHNVAGEQRHDGSWHLGGVTRPPMQDGDFTRTAFSIRALSFYKIPGRKAEFEERIARAANWLKHATPRSTEDRNMQLLGLKWAGADAQSTEAPLKALIATERADGGWAQTPELASDAYGTATVLFTLHELGVPASHAAYAKGVQYLLRTQKPDGSWYVASRSPKFQPYFQSGFPYDHDQWISSAATAWASIALMNADAAVPERASIH